MRKKFIFLIVLLFIVCQIPQVLAEEITATLHPQPSVQLNQPVTVSFGMPFPKWQITDSGLIRVKEVSDNEIQSYVSTLLPWRDISTGTDLSSIRSALIQFEYTFSSLNPVNIVIETGVSRTQNNPNLDPVKDNWVLVDDQEFPSQYGVYEPIVYVTLPASFLGECEIKTKTAPFGTFPDWSWYDDGITNENPSINNGRNFFKTMINDVDPLVTEEGDVDYLNEGEYEPWLFDRATTMYQFYVRSGDVDHLKWAHRNAYFYGLHIDNNGYFDLKVITYAPYGDLKYSYGESILTDMILTGNNEFLSKFDDMASAANDYNYVLNAERNSGLWTERHISFAWLIQMTAFEATGNSAYANTAETMFEYFLDLQDNPPSNSHGQSPYTGALMHPLQLHEGWWEAGLPYWVFSPWMSTLFVDAMKRYYIHSEDDRVLESAMKFGDAIIDYGVYDADMEGTKTVPWYIASPEGGSTDSGPWADKEHCLDVAKITGYAYYAAVSTGSEKAQDYLDITNTLLECAEWNQDGWIRPGGPAGGGLTIYRLSPPRKVSWWFRPTMDLDYLLNGEIPKCSSDSECGEGRICCSEACINPCNDATECNDGLACTVDSCVNPGSCTASCSYSQLTSCIKISE